ncbi:hypothetical protein JCM11251_006507 [Rhodosporidiobolus azoricus]
MRLARTRRIVLFISLALILLKAVAAQDIAAKQELGDEAPSEETPTTVEETTSTIPTDEAMPTLPETNTVPQACAGLRACQALQEAETATATATGTGGPTATDDSTALWATKTSGGMEQHADANDAVILHTDSSISYTCPTKGDEWKVESLTDGLSAHTATGAGCTMEYTFTGNLIQIYGATGKEAGVFGCEVELTKDLDKTGWWQGYAGTDTFRPYQGSCRMAGLGYDKHTVRLINSPSNPQKVYFTGLRFSTNQSQSAWDETSWDACCGTYTFEEGEATTVATAPSATSTKKGSTIGGLDTDDFLFLTTGLAGVIILSSLLIGCLCCRKRPAAGPASGTSKLADALRDDGSSRPLRRRRRSRASPSPSETETGDSQTEEETEDDTDDEKPRRKGKRR